jgi:hypothetical protein
MGLLTAKPRTWMITKCAKEMTWGVAALACLGQDLGNGTENGEVGMVGGQSMRQLLSKDSGAKAWKHAGRSATAAAGKRSCIAVISWQNRRAMLTETAGKDVAKFGGLAVRRNNSDRSHAQV